MPWRAARAPSWWRPAAKWQGTTCAGRCACRRGSCRRSDRTSGDKRHTKCPESGCEQGKGAFEPRGVVLLQRAWSGDWLCGRRGHFEVAERRRLGQLQGGEDLALASGGQRTLGDPAFAGLQGDEVQALKLVADASPGLPGGVLDDADEEQCQPAEPRVGADAVLAVVEHRAQAQRPLHVAPAALDLVELPVGGGEVRCGERLIGGAQQPLAVEALVTFDGGAVEAQLALLGAPQQAVEGRPRAQRPDELVAA